MSLEAAQVSSEAHRPYDTLYTLATQEQSSEIRDEVIAIVTHFSSFVLIADAHMQINIVMSRLTGPTIGFHFAHFFAVTANILISVFSLILSYFFVINEYWQ